MGISGRPIERCLFCFQFASNTQIVIQMHIALDRLFLFFNKLELELLLALIYSVVIDVCLLHNQCFLNIRLLSTRLEG